MKKLKIIVITILLFSGVLAFLYVKYVDDTAIALSKISKGMLVDEVYDCMGQEDDSKTIEGKTYLLYKLFSDREARYFGMRHPYIIVTEDNQVIGVGKYCDFFLNQEALWTRK